MPGPRFSYIINSSRHAPLPLERLNLEHAAKHGVEPEEAEEVVLKARRPYPQRRGDGKWAVWGSGRQGRLLQVIYVVDPDGTIFVIHARPLTEREKRQYRRSRRHET